MKITDVKINGFGVWSGLTMEHMADDVTVIYGPNEAGKTTLMQFMRTVLYGFTPERRSRYLPPVNGGQIGGSLKVGALRGNFEIQRRGNLHDNADALGDVTVTDSNGSVQSPFTLSTLLAGVDESIFDNVFAIGLREMQEVGTLNDSAAAEQLYKLTSGLDRVSLMDVMRELSTARKRILSGDEQPSQLTQFLSRREILQREIDELASRGRRWPQLAAQRNAMGTEITQIELAITDLQKQIHSYDLVLQVRDKWFARRQIEEQLAVIAPAADLPPDALEQLEAMNLRLKKLQRRLVHCKKQRSAIREDLGKHQINRSLLTHAARVQALTEHGTWINSLEGEVARLQDEVAGLEREVESRRPQIDVPAGTPKAKLPEISAKTLGLLRVPAGRMVQLNKLAERAQREADAVKVRTDQHIQRINSELADLDESNISLALEKAGTRVAQLRRRIQLEERLDELQVQKRDMESQSHDMFDAQVMPFEKMLWLFAGFAFSTLLIFSGVFGGFMWSLSPFMGFIMVLIGFGSLAMSVVTKLEWERDSRGRLDTVGRQLDLVAQQLKETREEADELDEQMPSGGGPLDARLMQAEKHLEHLEQLAPMASQRVETTQHVDNAERRSTKFNEDLKEAKKTWQTALRSAGLPDSLAPADVRHLARGFKQVSIVRRQLNARRDELSNRQRELGTLSSRITELFTDCGLKLESDSAQSQLKFLTNALAEQQQVVQRRNAVRQQLNKLKSLWKKARRSWEIVTRSRRTLLAKANAETEADLRQMISRQHQAVALKAQRDEIAHQIRMIVGEQWSDDGLARELLHHDGETPETRRGRIVERLQETKNKLAQLHERRGQLAAEMKTLAADRRLGEAKLELGCVEEQIVHAVRRWQVLAATWQVLESVRGSYESTRQPETLREASQYLQRLTNGQYIRIWTPVEERVLRVDDSHGQTLTLDKLSRGTREGVFLSLRLALVAGYARRGATLPLILDDILVNFDSGRVKSAAVLLREFAQQGHQMMMFTCHEHIMQIFRAEHADIRFLPTRNGGPVPALPPLAEVFEVEEPLPTPVPQPVVVARPAPLPTPVIVPPRRPVPVAPAIVLPSTLAQKTIVVQPPRREREEVVLKVTSPQPVPPPQPTADRRFTWETPELYVEEPAREAVA